MQRIKFHDGESCSEEHGTVKTNEQRDTNDTQKKNVISLDPPTTCPACGSPVVCEELSSTATTIGQVVRCGGPPLLCTPRAVTSLAHAYSRDALDVTGLSEARIQQLLDAGLLRFPCDVFQWSEDNEWKTISETLTGWGPKSSNNMKASVQQVAKNGISLGRFIYSLGVRHVGKHSSELVASCYGTAEDFLKAVESAAEWKLDPEHDNGDANTSDASSTEHPFSVLEGKAGIGPVLISSMISFSKEKELVAAARDLAKVVQVLEQPKVIEHEISNSESSGSDSKPWHGFRVVFTGGIANLTRSQAQNAAKELLGAKATPNSVSKSTDVVVHGDKGGKKLNQALALGVQTITADEFLALIGQAADR